MWNPLGRTHSPTGRICHNRLSPSPGAGALGILPFAGECVDPSQRQRSASPPGAVGIRAFSQGSMVRSASAGRVVPMSQGPFPASAAAGMTDRLRLSPTGVVIPTGSAQVVLTPRGCENVLQCSRPPLSQCIPLGTVPFANRTASPVTTPRSVPLLRGPAPCVSTSRPVSPIPAAGFRIPLNASRVSTPVASRPPALAHTLSTAARAQQQQGQDSGRSSSRGRSGTFSPHSFSKSVSPWHDSTENALTASTPVVISSGIQREAHCDPAFDTIAPVTMMHQSYSSPSLGSSYFNHSGQSVNYSLQLDSGHVSGLQSPQLHCGHMGESLYFDRGRVSGAQSPQPPSLRFARESPHLDSGRVNGAQSPQAPIRNVSLRQPSSQGSGSALQTPQLPSPKYETVTATVQSVQGIMNATVDRATSSASSSSASCAYATENRWAGNVPICHDIGEDVSVLTRDDGLWCVVPGHDRDVSRIASSIMTQSSSNVDSHGALSRDTSGTENSRAYSDTATSMRRSVVQTLPTSGNGAADDEAAASADGAKVRNGTEADDSIQDELPPMIQPVCVPKARCPSILEVSLVDAVMQRSGEAVDQQRSDGMSRPSGKDVTDSTNLSTDADAAAGAARSPPRPKHVTTKAREERLQGVRRRTLQRRFSKAIASMEHGEAPDQVDTQRVTRLFHSSIPRSFATITRIERVTNRTLYSRFRSLAAAELGCEAVFYVPPDPSQLNRLQEDGFSATDFQYTSTLGHGVPVAVHAGVAHRRAVELQKQSKGDCDFCICVLLCCPGKLGAEGGTASDKLTNPLEYCVVDPERLYVAYVVQYRIKDMKVLDEEDLALGIREAEQRAVERHRAAKVRWLRYSQECDALLERVLNCIRRKCADASERSSLPPTRMVTLPEGSDEAEAVISLYIRGGGGVGRRRSARDLDLPREAERRDICKVTVMRVENYALFQEYCKQGCDVDLDSERSRADSGVGDARKDSDLNNQGRSPGERSPRGSSSPTERSPRGSSRSTKGAGTLLRGLSPRSPRRENRAPRFREQVLWHGTRLKKEDGDGGTLDQKLRSIAEKGFEPWRCIKGAHKDGGIWAATAPLASFGLGQDGRVAFVMCIAKTLFNEWVDTSCVRVLSRERVLPLYTIMHA